MNNDSPVTLKKKPLVIFHGNCIDGFGAAWAFWHVFKLGCDYMEGHYGGDIPDVTDRVVYLVDFSYKRSVVEEMLLVATSITYIDHHKSAIQDLAGLEGLIQYVDNERSGAVLAWDFLTLTHYLDMHTREIPKLLLHIQDRDLWQFKLGGTKEITQGLFSYEYQFPIWDDIVVNGDQALLQLYSDGAAIARKESKDIRMIIKTCMRDMYIGGYIVPAVNAVFSMASEVGSIVAPGHQFCAIYYDTEDRRIFSLRSVIADGGIDVSTIAFLYGGGGHAQASGFSVPRNHPLGMA
jgi:oligoribonuclease NrnB/cAMP/cGMP phosphodiesterase (DHH superfamily)